MCCADLVIFCLSRCCFITPFLFFQLRFDMLNEIDVAFHSSHRVTNSIPLAVFQFLLLTFVPPPDILEISGNAGDAHNIVASAGAC